jgi:hypothetical protein
MFGHICFQIEETLKRKLEENSSGTKKQKILQKKTKEITIN